MPTPQDSNAPPPQTNSGQSFRVETYTLPPQPKPPINLTIRPLWEHSGDNTAPTYDPHFDDSRYRNDNPASGALRSLSTVLPGPLSDSANDAADDIERRANNPVDIRRRDYGPQYDLVPEFQRKGISGGASVAHTDLGDFGRVDLRTNGSGVGVTIRIGGRRH